MRRLLCTIGFAGKTAEEFFGLLAQVGVEQIIDIRQNRGGQLSGFAKHPDLSFFLRNIARVAYVHEPLLAPPPELLKAYCSGRDWPAYEAEFLAVMKQRGVPESLDTSSWSAKMALLCSEPGPERCHRRLVADILSAHWQELGDDVEIRHLVTAPSSSPKPRRKKAGAVS